MLTISILAFLMYSMVIARSVWFCMNGGRFREDDRTEVAFLMASAVILLLGHVALCLMEPWKMINNSLASSIIVGHSIFMGAYIFHRIGSLIDGRDRRQIRERRERRAHS